MLKDVKEAATEMLKAARCDSVQGFEREPVPGEVIHEMGTARMGRDPKTVVPERLQPVPRVEQRVRDRRLLHALQRLPEPVVHLHGAHRAGLPLRGATS